ncbi:MAG: RsmE family RNA methyltransferase [Bacilli bacterium]|jgi:16S rRNA (uracil1498-N3)-methyltransferase|nr:RsmE family RNA methyltransferase [Bacillota bacterium]OQC50654.1 MAG: Ribosomal RNA small subunit methyltransferase E [Tenericutes bacterium ADurb.Bin024]HOA11535.1 RsmE family RNA methyltransferase [Bacilli bacterium]HOE53667.1 RsmE family RNA methyltransferase [Bacilli bacterium]HOM32830.1 RsmE family RNA methyltransferase [Bacilli bacterium]
MSYRFFGRVRNNEVVLSDDDIFHLTKVLRLKKDETFEVVAGQSLYLCTYESVNPFILNVLEKRKLPLEPLPRLTLGYALPKGDKLELVIQKAVEIGVSHIILIDSERSIGKIPATRLESRLARFNKIIKSAAMQANRNYLPTLTEPLAFKEVLDLEFDTKLIAHETANLPLKAVLQQDLGDNLLILVGPEGGFSEAEVTLASTKGFNVITFGDNILRSETAAIYALSVLHHYQKGAHHENL